MVYTLLFFSSKRSLLHNSNVFGSCIIHILYTGCAKIKKKILRQKVNGVLMITGYSTVSSVVVLWLMYVYFFSLLFC